MGIFSFFRKKKAKQILSKSNLVNSGEIDNSEFIQEVIISPAINDEIEIISLKEIEEIEEEIQKEIYEDLEEYDPTKDLSHYYYPSVDLLKADEPICENTEEVEQMKDKIISTLEINNIGIVSITSNIGYVNTFI